MSQTETPEVVEAEQSATPETAETPERPGQVEATGSRPDVEETEGGKRGGPDPFQAQRRVTEKLSKKMERIEEMLEKLSTQTPSQPQTATPQQSVSDPNAEVDWTNLPGYISKKVSEGVGGVKSELARNEAEQYVLSQEYIDPDKDMEYLKEKIQEFGLDGIKDPMKQAQALLNIVKAERGIGARGPEKAKARAVPGVHAPVGGFMDKSSLKGMSMEEYEKVREKVLDAAKEGKANF